MSVCHRKKKKKDGERKKETLKERGIWIEKI